MKSGIAHRSTVSSPRASIARDHEQRAWRIEVRLDGLDQRGHPQLRLGEPQQAHVERVFGEDVEAWRDHEVVGEREAVRLDRHFVRDPALAVDLTEVQPGVHAHGGRQQHQAILRRVEPHVGEGGAVAEHAEALLADGRQVALLDFEGGAALEAGQEVIAPRDDGRVGDVAHEVCRQRALVGEGADAGREQALSLLLRFEHRRLDEARLQGDAAVVGERELAEVAMAVEGMRHAAAVGQASGAVEDIARAAQGIGDDAIDLADRVEVARARQHDAVERVVTRAGGQRRAWERR
jgi:hypothetical protein